MLNQKPFGIPIVLVTAAIVFLFALACVSWRMTARITTDVPVAGTPRLIDGILALTERIVALDASSGTTSSDELRSSRLRLIASGQIEVQNYLIDHFGEEVSPQYLSLMRDYLLLAVGPVFMDSSGGDDVNALIAIEHIEAATATEADPSIVGYERSQILNAIDVGSLKDSLPSGIFMINDYPSSGAYNIFGGVYRITMQGSRVEVANLPVVEEVKSRLALRGTAQDGADAAAPFLFTNAIFDPSSKVIVEDGMLPFGLYPCSDANFFKIESDRLINIRTETPIACIGKEIGGPEDVDRLFSPDTNFGIRKVTYQMATSTYQRALGMSLMAGNSSSDTVAH